MSLITVIFDGLINMHDKRTVMSLGTTFVFVAKFGIDHTDRNVNILYSRVATFPINNVFFFIKTFSVRLKPFLPNYCIFGSTIYSNAAAFYNSEARLFT